MAGQPYMHVYPGDEIKATRLLTLEEKGARSECIYQMHENDQQGFFIGTWADISRMMGANGPIHAKQILSKLQAKKIFEIVIESSNSDLESEVVKVIYPPMVERFQLSQKRSIAGSAGGKKSSNNKKYLSKNKSKDKANIKQSPDYDYDNDYDNDNNLPKDRGLGKGELNIEFEVAWDLYKKKVGDTGKLKKMWAKLSNEDRQSALEYIPKYVAVTPDKNYRKNFQTFLSNHGWKDELPLPANKTKINGNGKHVIPADKEFSMQF